VNTIASLVLAARHALEALSDTLRRGTDATLETADACTALRALADAWARVLPRLPADVTPPEWPYWRYTRMDPHSVSCLAVYAPSTPESERDGLANRLDRYADGLRAWGREAVECAEELGAHDTERHATTAPSAAIIASAVVTLDPSHVGRNANADSESASSLANVTARLLAGEAGDS
jgi:hypothetical protein